MIVKIPDTTIPARKTPFGRIESGIGHENK
jgi:hypothetical protein